MTTRNALLFEEIYDDHAGPFIVLADFHPDNCKRTPGGFADVLDAVSDRLRPGRVRDALDEIVLDLEAVARLGDHRRRTRKLLKSVDDDLRRIRKALGI